MASEAFSGTRTHLNPSRKSTGWFASSMAAHSRSSASFR